ncbi:MAG: hypothetical protein HC859_13050 [Bacteroidia bacterium]|nr:hypothetical protein [Bacteroidia bacterium]
MSRNNLMSATKVMQHLRKDGFEHDFRMEKKMLVIDDPKLSFTPEQVRIVDEYRFEGESDPADMSILYALETNTGEKGVIMNGYGVSANPDIDEFCYPPSNRTSSRRNV